MGLKQAIKSLIPAEYTLKTTHFKKTLLNDFYSKSYSGNGEDIILTQYIFPKKKNGVYVDIGAFHPKHISNTYALYKRGWHGINVDPNAECIAYYNKCRPDDKNIMVGITAEAGKKMYYNFSHSGANTFSEEHAQKKLNNDWNTLISKDQVECVTLAQLLEEHLAKGEHIDLLDVDVEGIDLEVLQSNDWRRYRPSVILVEDREFREILEDSPIYSFLKRKRYHLHSYMDITLIMVDDDFKE